MTRSSSPSTVATLVLSSRLGATLVRVALLVTVRALNTRPVGRLGTVATSVTELVAVTALDLGHVARLRALLRHVALLVAIAAGHDALLLALLSTMTLFTAVAATTTATLLRRLLAVASTVANFVAVDTLFDDLVLSLTLLLLAFGPGMANLVAVAADDDKAIHREASLAETVDVLLRRLRPAIGEDRTPWLSGPLNGDGVLLVRLALQVNESPVDGDLLLLGDQMGVEVLAAKDLLEILKGGSANRLGIGKESLNMYVSL